MSNTSLHNAAFKGDLRAAKTSLERGVNINAGNRLKDTALHLAVLNGHIPVIELLIEKGGLIEAKNVNNETPLHRATSKGRSPVVEILLNAGAELFAKTTRDYTPLHNAANEGHLEVVRKLVEFGERNGSKAALLADKNIFYETPLHRAAIKGHFSIVKALLEFGADPNAENKNGNTPLHQAASEGHKAAVRELLDYRRDGEHDAHKLLNASNGIQETALHRAVSKCHCQIVTLLLRAGADLDIKMKGGLTPLHLAVVTENSDVLKELINSGAKLEIQNDKKETPLHSATIKGVTQMMEILLNKRADMYNINETGNTGAHHAAFNGRSEVIKLLLEKGFDVNYKNTRGNTMLHLAAREGHIDLVMLLVMKNADLDLYSKTGDAAVHLAARLGYTDIVHKLITSGANPYNTENGWSVMHAAAFGNRLHTIQLLVTQLPEKFGLNRLWNNCTEEDCAHIVGNCHIAWWLRKQADAHVQNDTYQHSHWDSCIDRYERSGSDIIRRSAESSKRETDWIVKSISDSEIEMHYMDEQGNTMLHVAAENNNIYGIDKLIEAGVLLVARNYKNQTPCDLAKLGKHGRVEKVLDYYDRPCIDSRITSHLYVLILNIITQTVSLDIPETVDKAYHLEKEVQKMKLEAVQIVSKLLSKGVPHDPLGSCDRYLLNLAITTNNRTLLPVLLAAGLPLTTTESGLGIVQLAWRTPELTTWAGMVVTRAVVHKLQVEQEIIKEETDSNSTVVKHNEFLDIYIKELVNDLNSSKPWEAQFKIPKDQKDVCLTDLFVAACKHGATLTAWYIWMAGASTFKHVAPYNCNALGAALSRRKFDTACRLVLDMKANPFIEDAEKKIPISKFPEDCQLLEKLLCQDYRRLDRFVDKVKDDDEKRDFQKCILLLIVLFLQFKFNSFKDINWWKSYLTLILEGYSEISSEDTSKATLDWMKSLMNILVEKGVNGIKFTTEGHTISEKTDSICDEVGLKKFMVKQRSVFKGKDMGNNFGEDHFYDLFSLLQDNFSCLEVPEKIDRNLGYITFKAMQVSSEQHLPLLLHLLISITKFNVESIMNKVCKTKPLHHAARHGNSSAVAYMLQCGASPFVEDCSGILPADYAYMFGHVKIAESLMKHMALNGNDQMEQECSNVRSETKKSPSIFWKAFQTYLQQNGLKSLEDACTKYLPVKAYEDLLQDRLGHVRKEWELKGIKKAADDIVVSYEEGEDKEVREATNAFLTSLIEKIMQKDEFYKGKLEFVGSSEDNVRLYCPDEYDCNLILETVNGYPDGGVEATLRDLKPAEIVKCGHRKCMEVRPVKEELQHMMKGSRFHNRFFDIARKSLKEMDLEKQKLKILLPGIKKTQVGVDLCLFWTGMKYPLLFLSVDIVPTVKAPWPKGLDKPNCIIHDNLHEVHLNCVGEDEWRLSFGHSETQIMQKLSSNQRYVFLACKMILAALKTEKWVPRMMKCEFWNGQMFPLHSKGGFALKNSFFRELEEVTDRSEWESKNLLKRMCSIFERMCLMDEPSTQGASKEVRESIGSPRIVKAYFGGDTEKASNYLCAPEILDFLKSLPTSIIDGSNV